MSATDELRRLLDGRGVEWNELVGHPVVVGTEWHDRYGCPCTALEHADDVPDGMLSVQANLTPEQAIEATLGGVPYSKPTVLSDLQAENAKLRELVRDAWGDGHPDRSCEGCDIRDECHDDVERMRKDGVLRFSRCLFELRIEERMRELGVEVDG